MATKLTFKKFLTEVDHSDLELRKQVDRNQDEEKQKQHGIADENAAKERFRKEMASASPSRGDVIQSGNAKFAVVKMSMDGYHVKELSGQRTATVPHGTKFNAVGKTLGGKPMFVIAK